VQFGLAFGALLVLLGNLAGEAFTGEALALGRLAFAAELTIKLRNAGGEFCDGRGERDALGIQPCEAGAICFSPDADSSASARLEQIPAIAFSGAPLARQIWYHAGGRRRRAIAGAYRRAATGHLMR